MTGWMYQCNSSNVLLVEGNDDCNIIKLFCENNNINNFHFCNCRCYSKVISKLSSILKSSREEQPKVIGIILDADTDINNSYQDIKTRIKDFYSLPEQHSKNGYIGKSIKNLPKLGIWIMPNNQDNGALEEFYLTLLNKDLSEIEHCIQQAKEKGLTSFKEQHFHKAVMHTYFAWQDKPGMPLHNAINNISLNNSHKIAKNFKKWLERLYLN